MLCFQNKYNNIYIQSHKKNKKNHNIDYFDGDLIIDDYQINIISLQKIFSEFVKINTMYAYNIEGLQKILINKIPKNIWLDISINNGFDGVKIVKLLRKKYKFKGKIFAYIGVNDKYIHNRLKKIGIDHLLIKPVTQQKIIECNKYRV
jgi:CheY-like chemotaxis protein